MRAATDAGNTRDRPNPEQESTTPKADELNTMPDPIFAAIAEHQASIQNADRENERLEAADPDGDWRPTHAALMAEGAAAKALIETPPTTRAGLRALEDHLREDRNHGAMLHPAHVCR
jgi:hypothetical protein